MNNNLSLIGYRMPAEWELQESVWIAWPYNKSDWPGLFIKRPGQSLLLYGQAIHTLSCNSHSAGIL